MFVDPRQVAAGLLTVYMFAMLGNMFKEQIDSLQVKSPGAPNVQFGVVRVEEEDADARPPVSEGPWKAREKELKPCWSKPDPKEPENSRGYITFSLANGPEHHVSQVADAVVIARYFGAALVLPDIRGSELGQKRNFGDIYDVDKFTESLDGVIKIVRELPDDVRAAKPAVVRVPSRVTADYISKNIEPIFRRKSYLRLAILSSSVNLKMSSINPKNEPDSVSCLATFGTLELNSGVENVVHLMVERLKALSRRTDGHFVAVDLRVDALDQKECREDGRLGKKNCYNAQEIGELLRKIGFSVDTTIYLTQTWWHQSLNVLKGMFPKTYTKDDIIPSEEKGKFLSPGSAELVKALDFSICSQSDVFVPAIPGLFYEIVAGRRIASGRTQILVPRQVLGASSPSDFNSTYVSKRSHMAYSCHC